MVGEKPRRVPLTFRSAKTTKQAPRGVHFGLGSAPRNELREEYPMQYSDAGFWPRGNIMLSPSPHITPDSLLQDLTQAFRPRGCEVYKTALIGADLVLKKSG